MKILITGKDGQLARALVTKNRSDYKLFVFNKKELNIENLQLLRDTILLNKPDWIINTAAFTDVEKAENKKESAFLINAYAVEEMAKILNSYGGRLLQISTDFVFKGDKNKPYSINDLCSPINEYGKSKLEGEILSLKFSGTVVLRTSWLYSCYGNNFLIKILNLHKEFSKKNKNLNVVYDQIGSPTNTDELAKVCWKIIDKSKYLESKDRIFHWSNSGIISRYDFAFMIGAIAEDLGIIKNAAKVSPIKSSEYKSKTRRPFYSVLDCSETKNFLKLEQLHWLDALKETLKDYQNNLG